MFPCEYDVYRQDLNYKSDDIHIVMLVPRWVASGVKRGSSVNDAALCSPDDGVCCCYKQLSILNRIFTSCFCVKTCFAVFYIRLTLKKVQYCKQVILFSCASISMRVFYSRARMSTRECNNMLFYKSYAYLANIFNSFMWFIFRHFYFMRLFYAFFSNNVTMWLLRFHFWRVSVFYTNCILHSILFLRDRYNVRHNKKSR